MKAEARECVSCPRNIKVTKRWFWKCGVPAIADSKTGGNESRHDLISTPNLPRRPEASLVHSANRLT